MAQAAKSKFQKKKKKKKKKRQKKKIDFFFFFFFFFSVGLCFLARVTGVSLGEREREGGWWWWWWVPLISSAQWPRTL